MKRLRLILILLAVILLGCVALLFIGPKEPSYHGKTVSEWIRKFWEDSSASMHFEAESEQAILAIGTNALPTLLRLAGAHDSKLKKKLIQLANAQNLIHLRLLKDEEKRAMAVRTFFLFRTNAAPAKPGLLELFKNPNREVRATALRCLMWSLSKAEAVSNALTLVSNDADPQFRNFAAYMILDRYPDDGARLHLLDKFPTLTNNIYPAALTASQQEQGAGPVTSLLPFTFTNSP